MSLLLALISSLALGSSRAGGACGSPTLSSVPGACSGIELRVRVPPIQDVEDRTRREGSLVALVPSSSSLELGAFNKGHGHHFFWVFVCVCVSVSLGPVCK